uniref:Uncharacterized protein n=1 Tax=Anguilla anguilla TaxID=7936 RepID=A0A0E9V338_ANGAN
MYMGSLSCCTMKVMRLEEILYLHTGQTKSICTLPDSSCCSHPPLHH